MPSVTCTCGHTVEGENNYDTEAKAWHHVINEHPDMLKEMSVEQIKTVLESMDRQMESS